MGTAAPIAIHLDFGFQVGFTIVVSITACYAGWRLYRALSRQRAASREDKGGDGAS